MNKRVKELEIEVSYLTKELEELRGKIPEVHYHYTYDLSNMKPMMIADKSILKKLNIDFLKGKQK